MDQLTSNDIQNLNQGIHKLYTLNNFDEFGVASLQIVNQLVASDLPVFFSTDIQTGKSDSTFLPDFPDLTLEQIQNQSKYLQDHPIAQNLPQALRGATKISDFISQQEYHQLDGYQRFLRPLAAEDQMTLFLPNTNLNSWEQLISNKIVLLGFSFNRSQPSFIERDRLILNLLRPHLYQAYCNSQKYHQLQQSLNQLGLIILDRQEQVRLITPQASIFFASYFIGSDSNRGIPDVLRSWARHQIQNITTNDSAYLPLKIQQANKQLVIRLVFEQQKDQYLILMEEETTSLLDNLSLLGLSPKETEVIGLIIQGKDNKAIATQMNIGISTIRKHLESIYQKWGINSRTGAIAYALKNLGLL
jgi:DNA-binding CsgD family transcriptional regulator